MPEWISMIFVVLLGLMYLLSVLFILLYSSAQAYLLVKYILSKKNKKIERPNATCKKFPFITVQLPIYNEQNVVERLIDNVMNLNYPQERFEVQVLDDSTDETSTLIQEKVADYIQRGFNIYHVQRTSRTGFKAGALKHGLALARGEFIAIFDADFLPGANFLEKTLPAFADENVGMVQTRWEHINRNFSLLTDLQAFGLDAHFRIEQVGRNEGNCFINFNGTGGIWRKDCIIDAGNWEADTLTEDLDLSYRAQLKGWKFKYMEDVAAPAELPPFMTDLKTQQYRWTKGGAETARKHLKTVLKGPLSLLVKWQALAHLLNSAIFINVILSAFLSIPLLFINPSTPGALFFYSAGYVFLASFVVIGFSYLISSIYTKNSFLRGIYYFIVTFPMFISIAIGLSLHHAIAVIEGYMGIKTPFIRTPKYNVRVRNDLKKSMKFQKTHISILTIFEGITAILFIIAFSYSLQRHDYGLMIFHLLVATGFSLVFITTIWPGIYLKLKSQEHPFE